MSTTSLPGGHVRGFAETRRSDRWWVGPLATLCGLGLFVIYATWAAFKGDHYWHGSYLSPFYSPTLWTDLSAAGAAPLHHAWFGAWPSWWPSFLPASPALLILIFPLSFRFTCYYYRKAYYRAYAASPPACAVGGIRQGKYRGETGLMIFQNLHRYALYATLPFPVILSYDAVISFFRDGQFGIGVGSLVLTTNAVLLTCYTFGCHSFRHLIGGKMNCYSCSAAAKLRHGAWKRVSVLNRHHMLFAWLSLFWVGFSDLYVRLVSSGVITDLNTWGP